MYVNGRNLAPTTVQSHAFAKNLSMCNYPNRPTVPTPSSFATASSVVPTTRLVKHSNTQSTPNPIAFAYLSFSVPAKKSTTLPCRHHTYPRHHPLERATHTCCVDAVMMIYDFTTGKCRQMRDTWKNRALVVLLFDIEGYLIFPFDICEAQRE